MRHGLFATTIMCVLVTTAFGQQPKTDNRTCRSYFSTVYLNGESQEYDKSPISLQVWWENQGKNKYKGLCWENREAAKGANPPEIWILSWSAQTVTQQRPNPLDIAQIFNHPIIYNPGPPIEVTGQFLSANVQSASRQPDGRYLVGRVVFTKTVTADKSKKAFEDAIKDISKRIGH